MVFPLPLPQAIILRASQLIRFMRYGELRYHTILGKLQAINGFEISLPRAVCSWISQSLVWVRHGGLITIICISKCEKTGNFNQMGVLDGTCVLHS
jgi:hypothetical protein